MRGREEALNGAEPAASAPDPGKTTVLQRIARHVARLSSEAGVRSADTAFPPVAAHGIGGIRDFAVVVRCGRGFKLPDINGGGVADGLGAFAQRTGQPDPSLPAARLAVRESGVRTAPLLVSAPVRTASMPELRPPRTGTTTLLPTVSIRSWRLRNPGEGLRSRGVPLIEPPGVTDGGTGISPSRTEARIRDATKLARDLPHTRTGLPLAEISPDDAALFTKEAGELHGTPADSAEVLTLFRRVPIDAISCLRLAENATKLQFEVTSASNRTRARVHDLAAVRDTRDSQVHLVPHRNRYHTAHLT